jgi:hypothetical protein
MFIDYRSWQPGALLMKLQERNFLEATARMQWWYFDIAMEDGSVLVVAFMPRKWWRDKADARTEEGFLFASLMTADRKVRSFGKAFQPGTISCSKDAVEVPGQMSISVAPGADRGQVYRLSFALDGFEGDLEVSSSVNPYSPMPGGRKPGLARTLFEGAGFGASDFTYVSQVPGGTARGAITLDSHRVAVLGRAYHEQGRLEDAAESLSGGWHWFHFIHPQWHVFGTPAAFI